MKKILKSLATIALLCAIVFLGGEWPAGTPRKKVLTYDGAAFAVIAVCGLYLRKTEKDGQVRRKSIR